jgi:L-alanine-DL-glutamate epimerase-like enolase superfamily enzyme
MRLALETFTVHKRFPLTISRGTTSQTTNIWVRVEQQGIEGWGEASPFSIRGDGKAGISSVRQSAEDLGKRYRWLHLGWKRLARGNGRKLNGC